MTERIQNALFVLEMGRRQIFKIDTNIDTKFSKYRNMDQYFVSEISIETERAAVRREDCNDRIIIISSCENSHSIDTDVTASDIATLQSSVNDEK